MNSTFQFLKATFNYSCNKYLFSTCKMFSTCYGTVAKMVLYALEAYNRGRGPKVRELPWVSEVWPEIDPDSIPWSDVCHCPLPMPPRKYSLDVPARTNVCLHWTPKHLFDVKIYCIALELLYCLAFFFFFFPHDSQWRIGPYLTYFVSGLKEFILSHPHRRPTEGHGQGTIIRLLAKEVRYQYLTSSSGVDTLWNNR